MFDLLNLWFGWVRDWGYGGVVILMAMESSIFPVPSEIVVPPAAFWATQGRMSFWGVVLAATAGSWLGAAVTYWVSLAVGRPFLIRFGRFFFVNEEKLLRAERWLERYEAGGIFFARLLPVVRHLISIPAGVMRMRFLTFSVMTITGSFFWCTILAWFGKHVIGKHPQLMDSPQEMLYFIKAQSFWLVVFVAVICFLYFMVMALTAEKPPAGRKRV